MNVCILCSSNDLSEKYTIPARELARLLAAKGCGMVYGGSDHGLMKIMADEMQAHGARTIGITIPIHAAYVRKKLDECIYARTLSERKQLMFEKSDAIVTLIGGIGTLDELTELFELKRQLAHDKMIIVMNTDGFYDGLHQQLKRIADEKLFKAGENTQIPVKTLDNFVRFAQSPVEVINLLSE